MASQNQKCSLCKYNSSCNFYDPYCDLTESYVYDESDCPLNKTEEEISGGNDDDRK